MAMNRRAALKTLVAAGASTAAAAGPAQAREKKQAPPDAVGMLYDATLCIGCQACVPACREANGLDFTGPGAHAKAPRLAADTANVIKLFSEGELYSRMKMQCMHCIDPACVAACMLGAFQKREYGIVTWVGDLCIGCRYCQIACPFNVPAFEWDTALPKLTKCQLCLVETGTGKPGRLAEGKIPACCDVCPVDAVIFGKYTDLVDEAVRRVEEQPDRYYEKIYGLHDGGGTQVLYLSAAGIPFEKLGLPDLGPESVPALPVGLQHSIYQYFIAPAALYAVLGAVVWRNRRLQSGAEGATATDPDSARGEGA